MVSEGPYKNQRCSYPPVMPAIHYNYCNNQPLRNSPVLSKSDRFYYHLPGPVDQGQRMVNGFRSQFCHDDLPPHMTAGYQSFERETFNRGANNSAAAPNWPVNNLVMKQKRRKPCTRERLHPYKY